MAKSKKTTPPANKQTQEKTEPEANPKEANPQDVKKLKSRLLR